MPQNTSSYLDHLPTVLRAGLFIGPFLAAFERVLTGEPPDAIPLQDVTPPTGIEATLDTIHTFFDPEVAPEELLPWLAGWAATALRDEWDLATKRAFLQHIIPLYKKRGTRDGLLDLLALHAQDVAIYDHDADAVPPRFTATSPPHLFLVAVSVDGGDVLATARKIRQILAIIDQEKPAHTHYMIELDYTGMQINDDPQLYPQFGPGIQVGVNTLLGPCVPKIPSLPMQINEDPQLYPQYGPGIFVGANTVLGTPI